LLLAVQKGTGSSKHVWQYQGEKGATIRDEGMDLLAVVPFWEQPLYTHSPGYVSASLMAVIEGHKVAHTTA